MQIHEEARVVTGRLRAGTQVLQDAGITGRWSVEEDTEVVASILGQAPIGWRASSHSRPTAGRTRPNHRRTARWRPSARHTPDN